jgi:aminoglycoside phosphotransferase family enzyme
VVTVSSFPAIVETHTAIVVLVGDRVWKAKKPVRFPFVDFSTVESRRAACEREVALNRRFAPDVYLGVGEFVGPDGARAEPVVVMRRLPDDRRLSTLVARGEDVGDALRTLAHRLATVHASSDPAPAALASTATREGLRDRWELLISQADGYRGTVLDPGTYDDVVRLSRRYLDGRAPLFDLRVQDGFVGDGHGDLLADDVYVLDDGPRALDCLEFDARLRCVDGLDDAAFLAMDLERLGAPQLAARFLAWFVSFRGDPAPASLADLYVAYRARPGTSTPPGCGSCSSAGRRGRGSRRWPSRSRPASASRCCARTSCARTS